MRLAVGVVSYNNKPEELALFFRSLDKSSTGTSFRPEELRRLLIHNGEAIALPASARTQVLASAGNVGFAAAANRLMRAAFAEASVDAFVCANPDGAFHPDCLQQLAALAATGEADLVEARQFPEEHPKLYDPLHFDTGWASGACLLITRKAWQSLQGFDEDYFLYMEDIDLSWRARAAGLGVKLAPRALFAHDVAGRPYEGARARYSLLSQRLLAHKWHDPGQRERVEAELLRQGQFADVAQMPALPPAPIATPERMRVRDFENLNYYAPGRW